MKLAYYKDGHDHRWGAVDVAAGTLRRVGGTFEQWAPQATAKGSAVLDLEGAPIKLADIKLLPPLMPGVEIIGTGINYATWAIPPEGADTCFEFKSLSSFVGMEDTLNFPRIIDAQPRCEYRYELELGLVIGSAIEEPTAQGTKHVLGYTVVNDGCLRGQRPSYVTFDWTGSKCGYRSSSIGPWIATRDEFGDGQPDLAIIARMNGVVTQSGRSSGMRLGIDRLLEELSWRTALRPGDVFFTGTPGYTGIPDGVVGPGDTMEFEIEGIGVLKNYAEKRNNPPARTASVTSHDGPGNVEALLGELRRWDGEDVYHVKMVLEKLVAIDADAKGWGTQAHEFLNSVNKDMWPDGKDHSGGIEWWAIDSSFRRLYRLPGQHTFATGPFPHRRKGGTL
jgi:2-keto-4-pentenoate hydratase/2-oxohepta-3-ene-1,7-dioic acid hydratase in catechol pathway